MNKRILILGLVLPCLTTNVYAMPTCENIITACDQVIKDQKAQVRIRDEEISQGEAMLRTQEKQIEQLKRDQGAWYNNHTIWMIVGAVITIGVVEVTK